MDIVISITDKDEELILQQIAEENKTTPEGYATGLVRSFLQGQLKGYYMDVLKQKSVADLKTAVTAITKESK